MTGIISPEIKTYLSCLYFEAVFVKDLYDEKTDSLFGFRSIALPGDLRRQSKTVYSLVMEIMKKRPEWINNDILLNGQLVRINDHPCDYCNYYCLREKICEYLKKQGTINWTQFICNPTAIAQKTVSIKINPNNEHLLLLMLEQLQNYDGNNGRVLITQKMTEVIK